MAISFTRTREELRTLVLGKLGVLAAGGTASTADSDLTYEAIDLRLKEMHRLGIFWRKVTKQPLSFTIPANVASASASADVLFPISMHVVNGSVDDDVQIIGIREYADISDKTYQGVPTKVLYNGSAEFIFWPVPTAATTAKLVYEKIADDTAASTSPDVDVSMFRWLKDIIAYDLGDHFGKDNQTMIRFQAEAEKAERNIRKLSVERVDYAPVEIDEFYTRQTSTKRDWNTT